jgi:hypothetical protein
MNVPHYLAEREAARARVRDELRRAFPGLEQLLALVNEYVVHSQEIIYRSRFGGEHAEYIRELVISFTRSHFIAQDLLWNGEILEASTLLRRQLEIVARLIEIARGRRRSLAKTPLARQELEALGDKHCGPESQSIYQDLCNLAHPSGADFALPLGSAGPDGLPPKHPGIDENLIRVFRWLCFSAIEFERWAMDFRSENCQGNEADEWMLQRLLERAGAMWTEVFGPPPKHARAFDKNLAPLTVGGGAEGG